MTPKKKKCSQCKTEQPLSEFYTNRHVKSGYFARCKSCVKERQLSWGKTEVGKAYIQKARLESREKMKAYHAAYGRTEKAKQARRKYRRSERGKEVKKQYLHRRFGGEDGLRQYRRAQLDGHETPEKIAAWRQTHNAIRSGKLVRQPCSCGSKKSEAHHEDYSKPLDVTWLCASCHQKRHHAARILAAELDTY